MDAVESGGVGIAQLFKHFRRHGGNFKTHGTVGYTLYITLHCFCFFFNTVYTSSYIYIYINIYIYMSISSFIYDL